MTYVEAFASFGAGLALLAAGSIYVAGLVQLAFLVADFFYPFRSYPNHSEAQERNNFSVFIVSFLGMMLATSIMICWLMEVRHG